MKVLLFLIALVSAPLIANPYGGGNAGQGQLVAAQDPIVTDAYLDMSAVNAADHVDQLVEMCNAYANQRQVVLNVHHQNNAQVVRVLNVNRRVVARRNVRVVFVANNRRVVAHQNQVRVVVRARRGNIFDAVFNRGFNRAARFRAQNVISVRVRG